MEIRKASKKDIKEIIKLMIKEFNRPHGVKNGQRIMQRKQSKASLEKSMLLLKTKKLLGL